MLQKRAPTFLLLRMYLGIDSAPTNVNAVVDTENVTITWDPVPSATKYKVSFELKY